MDDDFQQLEVELKRLRPAAPTPALLARLERALAAPSRRAAAGWWFWAAAALPVAAALAVMITFAARGARGGAPRSVGQPAVGATPLAQSAFKPVAAENLLYAAHDEGLVTLADGTAARRERFDYVDTITWKNPRTNASVRWSVPREEVRVVPVNFQ